MTIKNKVDEYLGGKEIGISKALRVFREKYDRMMIETPKGKSQSSEHQDFVLTFRNMPRLYELKERLFEDLENDRGIDAYLGLDEVAKVNITSMSGLYILVNEMGRDYADIRMTTNLDKEQAFEKATEPLAELMDSLRNEGATPKFMECLEKAYHGEKNTPQKIRKQFYSTFGL